MGSPAEVSGPDEVAAGVQSLGVREGQKQQQCLERMTAVLAGKSRGAWPRGGTGQAGALGGVHSRGI